MNYLNIERAEKETDEAGEIALFYGFKPIASPSITKEDTAAVKNFDHYFIPEERTALIHMYFKEKMVALPQPVMFYCEKPFPGSKIGPKRKSALRVEASLTSIGSDKSVCECLSVQAAITILQKIGYKHTEVHLNSVGDKESGSEFQKKLSIFIRKNYNAFPGDLRQALKKDPLAVLKEEKAEWQKWFDECPKSIDFLSETSRVHFKEILECLEMMEIPYFINHHLVGGPEVSETIISIRSEASPRGKQEELACGSRFNSLAKKIGYKKELAAFTLNISAKSKKKLKKVQLKETAPKFFLVQFGGEAKFKSFIVLQELFKAKVSVNHAIAKDKLGIQMNLAESSKAAYIILLGQKEALENSVIVRNTADRSQEIVPIPQLSEYIKKLK